MSKIVRKGKKQLILVNIHEHGGEIALTPKQYEAGRKRIKSYAESVRKKRRR